MTGLLQLLLLVSATVASEPSCPACSKYDYEEKMLERMIRMEFAYEKLAEKVELDLNTIKDQKERTHAVVDVMKDKQEQAERKLASLMEEVERDQSSTIKTIVSDYNNTLEQTIAAFNDIKDQIATALVYFHVRSPQGTVLSNGEVIVYKRVETNQGNGYSSTTGKFTAPVRGLYLFLMHSCATASKYAILQIVKKGSVIMASVQYDREDNSCSSSQAFVRLDMRETIWVQCPGGAPNIQLHDEHPYQWTSFGGALIRT